MITLLRFTWRRGKKAFFIVLAVLIILGGIGWARVQGMTGLQGLKTRAAWAAGWIPWHPPSCMPPVALDVKESGRELIGYGWPCWHGFQVAVPAGGGGGRVPMEIQVDPVSPYRQAEMAVWFGLTGILDIVKG